MTKRRRHSEEFKVKAVNLATEQGCSVSEILHDFAQPPNHHVEDCLHQPTVRLLTQHLLKPRHVPLLGNPLFRDNPDHPPQPLVATQLRQTGFDCRMPQ